MQDAFFASLRPLFGGSFRQSQLAGLAGLLQATSGLDTCLRAYILATAFHETAQTMQPIREYGRGRSKTYGKVDQSGKAPYGRGYVQLTWRENYLRADRELGLEGRLAADYDLALSPEISAQILVRGMCEGWFTQRKLQDYLPKDYVGARQVVNGRDKAALIADYAIAFEAALGLLVPAAQAQAKAAAQIPAFLRKIASLFKQFSRKEV